MTKMSRYECETKILDLAQQISDTYKAYNPAPGFMSLIIDGKYLSVSDCYFTETNGGRGIIEDCNGCTFNTIDAVQYSDGRRSVTGLMPKPRRPKSITIGTLSELRDTLNDAMSSVWSAIETLNEYDTDDDFRIWADILNDLHRDMGYRYDQLDRDAYAEEVEHQDELRREYYYDLI